MRKLRNTLYITEPLAKISKEGEAVTVTVDSVEVAKIPLLNLEGIVCFNYTGISPSLMEACWKHSIRVSFISPYGKYLGRIEGRISGNVLLRKKQYQVSDNDDLSSSIAKNFVLGKLINCRSVLQRFSRDYGWGNDNSLKDNYHYLSHGIQDLVVSKPSIAELMGIEGKLTQAYFNCFNTLILSPAEEFRFEVRSRRPPLNPVNALLSFSYSLIAGECAAALESVGLDPQVGFLHQIRPGRVSLALDLMEEFRPYLGDRFVLKLINNRILKPSDFLFKENGAVLLTDFGRKTFLTEWQKRKKEEIYHPYMEERVEVGLLPYAQALLLARFLRGDLDEYPPFLMK